MQSTKSADLIDPDKFVSWRQLDGCSVTRPFLSLRRVWLARLVCGSGVCFSVTRPLQKIIPSVSCLPQCKCLGDILHEGMWRCSSLVRCDKCHTCFPTMQFKLIPFMEGQTFAILFRPRISVAATVPGS